SSRRGHGQRHGAGIIRGRPDRHGLAAAVAADRRGDPARRRRDRAGLSACACRSRAGARRVAAMTRSVCTILIAITAAGCGRQKTPDETVESEAPVLVHVAKAGPARVSVDVKAPGTTVSAPGAEIVITAPQQARVVALPHGEGDHVKAGDLLVEFEIP